jgi:hypothetical protein
VHRVIEGLGRGRRGAGLVAFARAVAVDEGLAPAPGSADAAAVGASEVVAAELATTAERAWASVAGQGSDGAATRRFEWTVALADTEAGGAQRVTEGVIDAAAFDGLAWQVLDWKTDEVDDETWAARAVAYQAQVDRYAEIIGRLRGEAATGLLVPTSAPRAPVRPQPRSE